ncbi:Sodium-dependent multivitamin transporter [Chionoecetes opilio]|uniref:Sodium-dependent multivitamin transporter n=1 Tax=Chionoecetes opilio TaxID=41210 RepID=A0A8J4XKL8_CHIOP|nr:Sodium-dependent multivitamin transporter [Chionoecetes opilio]
MLFPLVVTMGMVLYAPSIGLTTVTNLSGFASMAIMGAIVTFYITIGGVKAVVYTDVLQTLLMFGGVLVVVVLCCIELGGVGEVWAIAERGEGGGGGGSRKQKLQIISLSGDDRVGPHLPGGLGALYGGCSMGAVLR